jgi:hypothetical protein
MTPKTDHDAAPAPQNQCLPDLASIRGEERRTPLLADPRALRADPPLPLFDDREKERTP